MLLRRSLSIIYTLLFIPSAGLLFFALTFSTDSPYAAPTFMLQIALGFALPPLFLLVAGVGGIICSFGAITPKKELFGRIFLYLPLISFILYISYFLLY